MRKYFFVAVLLFSVMFTGISDAGELKIGSCIYTFNDAFMTRYRNAMADEAKKAGVELQIMDSQNSQSLQDEQVDELIEAGLNVLILNPVDRMEAGNLIEKAKAANIPVVFINRQPVAEVLSNYDRAFYVGSLAEESGRFSGEIIVDYFKAHPEADKDHNGKIEFIMLKGENGHQDMIARSKYSVEAIEKSGIFKPVELGSALANWDKFMAMTIMNAFIMSIGTDEIEAVIANNDEMALGAVEALKANDFNTGDPEKFIPVVGVDGNPAAIEAMKNHEIIGTVLQDAETCGSVAVKLAVALAQNKTPDKNITGYELIDGRYFWIPYKKKTEGE